MNVIFATRTKILKRCARGKKLLTVVIFQKQKMNAAANRMLGLLIFILVLLHLNADLTLSLDSLTEEHQQALNL